jgi:hypothetical protein
MRTARRRDGKGRPFTSPWRDEAPAHGAKALLTAHGDDGLDDLARDHVVVGTPIDFGEPRYAEFLGDHLLGARARDASAHGFAAYA